MFPAFSWFQTVDLNFLNILCPPFSCLFLSLPSQSAPSWRPLFSIGDSQLRPQGPATATASCQEQQHRARWVHEHFKEMRHHMWQTWGCFLFVCFFSFSSDLIHSDQKSVSLLMRKTSVFCGAETSTGRLQVALKFLPLYLTMFQLLN